MPQSSLPAARVRAAKQLVLSACLASLALLAACDRPAAPDAGDADSSSNPQAALTVTTATVESRDLVRTVPATGSVFPWQEVIISPEVGGYRVDAVLVDVGSRVQKGQELVRLSTDMLDADLNSRRAALRSAEASLTNAAAALRRGESVSTSGALSAADLDQLRAEHVAAQARVETARADVTTAELRVRYGTVRSPDAGTITSRTVTVGQIAQAGQEMLRMLRLDRVEWRAEIPEAQLSRIKVGQQAEIFAADGSVLKGRVRTVAPTVQTNSRTGVAYVDITSGDARPGMFARGQISAGSGSGVLVPISSVVMQDGYSYVFVVKEGNVVERRRIEQAGVYGDQLEVGSGLAPGDVIAVRGAGFLKDGDTVAIAATAPADTAPVAAD
ncbi:MAG: efflux RND transporter periplasmic adaptor subunit [Pseudomonadota bacterium]|nr:efflux RND transporter periplasmic adaptor subunit [Pseudomonadota bacterium]